MNRKNSSHGTPASMARAAVENFEIALAIRAGRLTRALFEEWYNRREAEGTTTLVTLRPARRKARRRHARRRADGRAATPEGRAGS